MTQFFEKRHASKRPKFALLGFAGSFMAGIYAGVTIPWHPILSIIIFIATGLSLPFIYKYGVKGEDPRQVTEKFKDFFSRGKTMEAGKPGKEIVQQKPEAPTGTGRMFGSYKERFNMINKEPRS